MPEFFDFNSAEMSTVPVWIKLPNLPLRCWSLKSLSKIASVVGKPLQSDMLTSSMSRLSYACILVELDLRKPLREHIAVSLLNGVIIDQQVIYETLSKFCTHCHVIGHIVDSCSKVTRKVGVNKSQASAASVLPTPSSAEKVVLSSEGIESVHISVALAPPLTDEGLQDPMIYEAATGVYDWQPVPKKHTSNRQPKIGSVPVDLALGKDSSTSNGISVEAVCNVSGGTDLTALGSVAAGSAMGMGCVGLNGKLVGAVLQASVATDLGPGLRPVLKGVLGAKMASQRVNGRM
ncbi:hypothetical protein OIU76_029992 [Salix suchowensis]|nr:hypothetical protein OIU76_029992 [Salix suchowensis]